MGSQYFLNLYYDWVPAAMDFKVSIGKFLANDVGSRFQVGRYFPSGLHVYFWYTRTNANDHINGHIYHDTGFGFTMPIEIFSTRYCREMWGYGLSAWLRDCGYRTPIGLDLFDLIDDLRH